MPGRRGCVAKTASLTRPRYVALPVCSGNRKFRALRLESGNFSWGSEATTHKTRIVDGKHACASV